MLRINTGTQTTLSAASATTNLVSVPSFAPDIDQFEQSKIDCVSLSPKLPARPALALDWYPTIVRQNAPSANPFSKGDVCNKYDRALGVKSEGYELESHRSLGISWSGHCDMALRRIKFDWEPEPSPYRFIDFKLATACKTGNLEAAKEAILNGADVNHVTEDSLRPLIIAAGTCGETPPSKDIVLLLLSKGARIEDNPNIILNLRLINVQSPQFKVEREEIIRILSGH
ncbi:MAG: hypothetical protein WCK49_03245 [Myxococcaceae bacterium]